MYSDQILSEIQDKLSLSECFAMLFPTFKLKKVGSNLVSLSPFRNEKTASFTLNDNKNVWNDFGGSDSGFGIFKLIQADRNCSYPEAIRIAAAFANIKLPEPKPLTKEQEEAQALKASILIANEWAAKLFESQLSDQLHTYFEKRGFSREDTGLWRIGYAPKTGFLKAAKSAGFKVEILKAAGLLSEGDGENPFFKNRYIFPISDKYGNVIGFSGRVTNDKSKPKYINTKTVKGVYEKINTLYGFHFANRCLGRDGIAYLVEGYTDAMAMVKMGFCGVIATCGTAFSTEQARILKKAGCTKLVVIRDGDAAGLKSAANVLEIALKVGIDEVRVCELDEGNDPANYISAKSAFEKIVHEAKDGVIWQAGRLLEGADSPGKKKKAVVQIRQLLRNIPDAFLQNEYQDLVKKEYDIKLKASSSEDVFKMKVDNQMLFFLQDDLYDTTADINPRTKAVNVYRYIRKVARAKIEYGAYNIDNLTPSYSSAFVHPAHGDDFVSERSLDVNGVPVKQINFYHRVHINPEPFEISPEWLTPEGYADCPQIKNTLNFFKHIYSSENDEFLEFGLDYFALCWLKPLRRLPAQILVSYKEGTGKSTLVKFYKYIFGKNVLKYEAERLESNFNSALQGKLMVCIEETKQSKRGISEWTKDVITADEMPIERKGKDSIEAFNFIRLLFCSNHPDDCIAITPEDTRWAAFDVPVPTQRINNMFELLVEEAPYFLYWIEQRGIRTQESNHRLFFDPKQYETKALLRLKRGNISGFGRNFKLWLEDAFKETNRAFLKLTAKDIRNLVRDNLGKPFGLDVSYIEKELAKIKSSYNQVNYEMQDNTYRRDIISIKQGTDAAFHDTWTLDTKNDRGKHFVFRITDEYSPEQISSRFSASELCRMFNILFDESEEEFTIGKDTRTLRRTMRPDLYAKDVTKEARDEAFTVWFNEIISNIKKIRERDLEYEKELEADSFQPSNGVTDDVPF